MMSVSADLSLSVSSPTTRSFSFLSIPPPHCRIGPPWGRADLARRCWTSSDPPRMDFCPRVRTTRTAAICLRRRLGWKLRLSLDCLQLVGYVARLRRIDVDPGAHRAREG